MSYRLLEHLDREILIDTVVDHPDLHVEVRWWINGELQGTTLLGYRGFLISNDGRACIEVTAVEGCHCPQEERGDGGRAV